MSLNIDFSQMEAPSERSRGVLPAGWYTARIEKSEPKQNSTKTGGFLEMTYALMDAAYTDRKVFEIYNVWNPNPVAQKIAMEDLKRISMATGVMRIQSDNAQEFYGIPLKIQLDVEKGGPKPDGGTYPDKNRIVKYANINDPAAQAAPPSPNAAAPAAPAGFGPPQPWQQAPAAAQQAPAQAPPFAAPAAPAAPAYAAAPQPWAQPTHAAAPQAPAPAQAPPFAAQAPAAPAQPWAASPAPAAAAPAPASSAPAGAPPWAR